ncbi:HAD-IIIC family phosphatase [Thioclava sp. JE_KL1]|uniref:HAD-IIIC family phosphatase n=1 Tax=Thioclava sp. JE_KL1 TaxID=2651187 RepID=UPI00128CA9D9|nr:HAD-IIIC family phosphatase [Thioclava sp. JE_KL1]MPQ93459.1 HAD-IIIC family phosphatase [Thioclava sp. JE_KL1]
MNGGELELSRAIRTQVDTLAGDLQKLAEAPGPAALRQARTGCALLAHHLAQGEAAQGFAALAGWLKLTYGAARLPQTEDDGAVAAARWHDRLSPELSEAARTTLTQGLARLTETLARPPGHALRALFIGDCLIWDIATQLQIAAAAEGIAITPQLCAQRDGAELHRAVEGIGPVDLVFYAPFGFGFAESYARALAPGALLRPMARDLPGLRATLDEVEATLSHLLARTDAPVYLHDISGARQASDWRGAAADRFGARRRARVAAWLNARLDALVQRAARPVLRIPEAAEVHRLGPAAGRVLFEAGDLHPTALAASLASGPYLRACRAAHLLSRRKLVVSDLDNTLWAGEIGEGPITHHHDRQALLLRLKARGVLLAVASKNDPANISWRGAELRASDFVACEIDWAPKAGHIAKIAAQLNLAPESFVFLDDRADERALAEAGCPGLLALDPNLTQTWQLLDDWAVQRAAFAGSDRTTLYQARAARQDYVATPSEDPGAAYRQLGLRVAIRIAKRRDLPRVGELIARTNQFNTTQVPISAKELSDPSRRVLIAEARDRFGSMGIVSALVIADGAEASEITQFVLSCRAFGYGIETALLQTALAAQSGRPLRGRINESPLNAPCREVYAANGFKLQDGIWTAQEPRPDLIPDWLSLDIAPDLRAVAAQVSA